MRYLPRPSITRASSGVGTESAGPIALMRSPTITTVRPRDCSRDGSTTVTPVIARGRVDDGAAGAAAPPFSAAVRAPAQLTPERQTATARVTAVTLAVAQAPDFNDRHPSGAARRGASGSPRRSRRRDTA